MCIRDSIRDMESLMADTTEEAERRIAKSVNGVTGIPTGLTELDKKTGGLQAVSYTHLPSRRRRIRIAPTSRSEFLNLLFTIIHL